MRSSPLLQFVLFTAAACIIVSLPALFGQPLPQSLVILYIFFSILMILLVITVTDKGAEGLLMPFVSFVKKPRWRRIRGVVFILIPLFAAFFTYRSLQTEVSAPLEQRHVHPSPPDYFMAYGKKFEVQKTVNPFRALEKTDLGEFKKAVKEGGRIYFKNCFFCHGARLNGRGHYAGAFNPSPLPFSGANTIAQLQESYLFWRIVKGGPGLPYEGAPWNSAMPAWEGMLSSTEVWKTILFLYDYTGNRPQRLN